MKRLQGNGADGSHLRELPAGWAWVRLSDVAAAAPRSITDGPFGSNLKSEHYTAEGARVIRLENIGAGHFIDKAAHISEDHYNRLSQHAAETSDVIIAILGSPLPRACRVPEWLGPAIVKADCIRFRADDALVDGAYVCWWLNSDEAQKAVEGSIHGVGRPRLGMQDVRDLWVPMAPRGEQTRIVAKVDELFSDIDAGERAFEQAALLVRRYRQSVLKAAVTGELTREWRQENLARLKTEKKTGADLLAGILTKRLAPSAIVRTARISSRSDLQAHIDDVDEVDVSDLPEGWTWCTIEQVASQKPRSIQSGPFGSALLHSEFRESGRLVIGIDNVQDGYFSQGSENRISDAKFRLLKRFSARPKDVLITVMATIGRTCVVPADIEEAIITKHVYRITVDEDLALPEYVHLCLWGAPIVRRQIVKNARGQTRPGLNGTIVKNLRFPLPLLKEQSVILSKVDELLSIQKQVQKETAVLSRHPAALRQSILRSAFSGRLVQQDPRDEPASVLLERIRGERRGRTSTGTTVAVIAGVRRRTKKSKIVGVDQGTLF